MDASLRGVRLFSAGFLLETTSVWVGESESLPLVVSEFFLGFKILGISEVVSFVSLAGLVGLAGFKFSLGTSSVGS